MATIKVAKVNEKFQNLSTKGAKGEVRTNASKRVLRVVMMAVSEAMRRKGSA